MKTTKMATLALAGAALLGSGAAPAALVEARATLDLVNGGGLSQIKLFDTPLDIAAGDHVTLEVDFLGDQALTIFDGDEYFAPWFYSADNDSAFTLDNVVVTLLGFSGIGGAASSYARGTVSSAAAHLGPELRDFLSPGQGVSFGGYQTTYDIASIAVSPHPYPGVWMVAMGNAQTGRIPEPSSLALLGLALGGWVAGRRPSPCSARRSARRSGAGVQAGRRWVAATEWRYGGQAGALHSSLQALR